MRGFPREKQVVQNVCIHTLSYQQQQFERHKAEKKRRGGGDVRERAPLHQGAWPATIGRAAGRGWGNRSRGGIGAASSHRRRRARAGTRGCGRRPLGLVWLYRIPSGSACFPWANKTRAKLPRISLPGRLVVDGGPVPVLSPGEPSTSPDVGNQFLDSRPRGDGVRAKPPTSRSTSSGDRTKPPDSRALRLGGSPSPSAEIYSTELYSASVEAPLPSGNGDGGLPAERRRPPLLRRTGSPQITEPSASTCSGTASTYSGSSGPAAAHARGGATQRIHLV